MARSLKDKVVVITGGAVGIGHSIAVNYLKKGVKVAILLDIDEKRGVDSAEDLSAKYGNGRAVFIKCDVTKDLEVIYKQIIDTYKNVDVLVNNAGILNELQAKRTIDINVAALIEWSLKFWEHMRKDKNGNGGTIINLASRYGYRIDQYLPIYQASKFAVFGFTKSLGHSYNFNRSGVRVIVLCPGFSRTSLVNTINLFNSEMHKDFEVFLSKQPWQEVESVGEAAVEVFEKADSGTAWLIEGAKPVVEV